MGIAPSSGVTPGMDGESIPRGDSVRGPPLRRAHALRMGTESKDSYTFLIEAGIAYLSRPDDLTATCA